MNIYEKLQNMRVELQERNLKKSGKNKYAGYDYYELSDILPSINELQAKYKTCSVIRYNDTVATLELINCEKPDEAIMFTSPMCSVSLKGAHEIQNMGALETYSRRYLYMTVFEVVESEFFDAVQGKPQQNKQQQNNKSKKTIDELKRELYIYIKAYALKQRRSIEDITEEMQVKFDVDLKEADETILKQMISYLYERVK